MNHCFPERTGTPMAIDTVCTKTHTHTNPHPAINIMLFSQLLTSELRAETFAGLTSSFKLNLNLHTAAQSREEQTKCAPPFKMCILVLFITLQSALKFCPLAER